MRKIIAVILSTVMLFTVIPMRAAADCENCDHCDHSVMIESGLMWEIVYGDPHPYTASDGSSAMCHIFYEKEYKTQKCMKCSFVRKIYTGKSRYRHEVPSHR